MVRSANLGNNAGYLASSSAVVTGRPMSWALWVRMDNLKGAPYSMNEPKDSSLLLAQSSSDSDELIEFVFSRNLSQWGLFLSIGAGGSFNTIYAAANLVVDDWYLLGFTWDASGAIKVYADGVQVGTGSSTLAPAGLDRLYSGRAYTGSTRANGLVSDIQEYPGVVLTADQWAAMAAGTPPGVFAPTRWWNELTGAGPHSPAVGAGDFTESGTVGDGDDDPPINVFKQPGPYSDLSLSAVPGSAHPSPAGKLVTFPKRGSAFTDLSLAASLAARQNVPAKRQPQKAGSRFTDLSLIALPGLPATITAKRQPQKAGSRFTDLSLIALPGLPASIPAKRQPQKVGGQLSDLSLSAGPGAVYGDFGGKQVTHGKAAVDAGTLSLLATPGGVYGAMGGKLVTRVKRGGGFTAMSLAAVPGSAYPSASGKLVTFPKRGGAFTGLGLTATPALPPAAATGKLVSRVKATVDAGTLSLLATPGGVYGALGGKLVSRVKRGSGFTDLALMATPGGAQHFTGGRLVHGAYMVLARLDGDPMWSQVAATPATSHVVTGEPGTRVWYQVRAHNARGRRDEEPLRQRLVAFDDDGALILPVPNRPSALRIVRAAGGQLTAFWSYTPGGQAVAPARFRVYRAIGDAAFDFNTPLATVTYRSLVQFSISLGQHAHGTRVRVIVRAESADGAVEQNHVTAEAVASATAPAAAQQMLVEVV